MEKKVSLKQIIINLGSISKIEEISSLPDDVKSNLKIIAKESYKQKGVYTVLTTLLYYKYLHPEQDVRNHQKQIKGGFSGRSFDTKNVTPILTEMEFPAMSESGWLTRSLEQPNPYNFKYPGKIPEIVKNPFLELLDYVEKHPDYAFAMLRYLLYNVLKEVNKNKIKITPLRNPDKLTIKTIVDALSEHFLAKYGTHNGAKLPVLAFHSIYTSLINEVQRYADCKLADLSSLTACDKTNKASGDIEIFNKDGSLYESIEIKLDKLIDKQIVQVAQRKIYNWNPKRYYILSVLGIKKEDKKDIDKIVSEVEENHGCQIIINGLIPTIKYYLRLIVNLEDFLNNYSAAIEADTELQKIHKDKWNELIEKYDL